VKKTIVVTICLSYLKSTKDELKLIEDDPNEFVNLGLDTCEKQKSLVPKTQAVKLLEALCDRIDGTVPFVTIFAATVISVVLGTPSESIRKEQLDLFKEYENSAFLKGDKLVIAESCLVALTALSYVIPKRPEMTTIFEETMSAHINDFVKTDSIIMRSRFALMLGYYADMIYKNKEDKFK
jgi:hypothetical protein